MVVADKEINSLEVEVLERYISADSNEEIHTQKQLIFSDDERQPGLPSLLSELRLINLTIQEKNEIVSFLADVAYGDDYISSQEKDLIFSVSNALNINPSSIMKSAERYSKERLNAARLSYAQRTVGHVENFIYELIPGQKSNNTIDLLLGSLGYSASIEEITDNALVDLERVSKIVDGINGSLTATEKSLNNLKFAKKNSSKEVTEVTNIVSGIKDDFDNLIDLSLKENIEVLEKNVEISDTLLLPLWGGQRRVRVHYIR